MATENADDDSWHFGVWPTLAGFAFGGFVVWIMFHLATGFS